MKRFIIFLSMSAMVGGCKVGPNYCVPETFVPGCYVEDKASESVVISDEALVHWWECAFQDGFLNELMEEALLCNFDLRIAMERVGQARANYWVQFTSILPEFDGDFQATHFRASQSFAANNRRLSGPAEQNFFQTGLDAIWQIDLFGKNRRAAESAYNSWQASVEDVRGVKITVLSEVANFYIMIRYFQAKVELARELVDFNEELLSLSRDRFESGLTNEEEVLSGVSTVESSRGALKVLELGLKQNIYSLAVLLGRLPEGLMCDFAVRCGIPKAMGKIPVSLPSELLRRRPDIAGAERRLAAQTEQIGVAVADLFPSVSLVGSSSSFAANPLQGANIGFSSDKLRKLFTAASRLYGVGALVTFPVFDFGKRWAAVNVQEFLTREAYLTYEKTVIEAFQEVEIVLSNYFKEEERYKHLRKEVETDERNLYLVTERFGAGLANYTEVLIAREKWLGSANVLTDSEQALGGDLVAIYNAMGGDW